MPRMLGIKTTHAMLALAFLSPSLAAAQDLASDPPASACRGFAWSLDRERAWFDQKRLPRRVSGARLRKIDRAVALDLQPTSKAKFFLPPERRPKARSFSGDVTFFGVPKPGQYQVTLSEPASIDVFENGARLKPVAATEAKDCAGLAKSLRYDLAPGDLVLVQVTGAVSSTINVAFTETR